MTHFLHSIREVMPEMENDQSLHPLEDVSRQIRQKRYRLATRRGYASLVKNIAVMAVLILAAFSQVFLLTVAKGTDMYPAVLDGDIILGYRLDTNYLKNDVVVCEVDGKEVIGRIVAREGDSVNITKEGTLFVNGTEQTGEIAFPTNPGKQTYPYTVPEGCVYLLGDYRTNTTDSRDFGPVEEKQIKAKVVSIFRRRGI